MDAHASQLECFAPATGELLDTIPIDDAVSIRSAVERARVAQRAWAELSVRERAHRLMRFRQVLLDNADELAAILSEDCGKPRVEGFFQEVGAVLATMTYYAQSAERILRPQRVHPRIFVNRSGELQYQPRGVIGIIGPFNYPLMLPFSDAMTALFAGNAVVIKPSEHTPLVARAVKRLWDASDLPSELLQIVYGRGEAGRALIEAGIQKVCFTGGVETGRRVAELAGRQLIECSLELGGKAPAIVLSDANLELAARAITFGGFVNAGQACVAVERVLAEEAIADELTERILEHTKQLRQGGPDGEWEVGPMMLRQNIGHLESLVADAVEKGGKILIGGRRAPREGDFFEPTLISECTEDMRVMREEIFGPIVPILRTKNDAHAIDVANSLPLGLNGYVFGEDAERARRVAGRVEAGSIMINDVIMDRGTPEVPFGGVKHSGYGKVNGPEGLRSMCHLKHVSEDRLPTATVVWFPYDRRKELWMKRLLWSLFSKRSPLAKWVARR